MSTSKAFVVRPQTGAVAGAPATKLAWHVERTDGLNETIVAHSCDVQSSGVLSFHQLRLPTDWVLIRAFSPTLWRGVSLVDVTVPIVGDPRR